MNTEKFEERLKKVENQVDDLWFWCFVVAVGLAFTTWKMNLLAYVPQVSSAVSSVTTALTGESSKQFQPSKDAPKFRYPFSDPHPLTSGFGMRVHPVTEIPTPHNGIDLAAPIGAAILAVADGIVESAGDLGSCGTGIRINHSGGYMSAYCHNSKNYVQVGQSVKAGQEIGLVGSTGMSTGPHLHLGMKKDGQWIDPKKVIPIMEVKK